MTGASRVARSNVFTLLTYFRVPEHMSAFEKLSVSSLTAVRQPTTATLRFVGPAHVAEPWKFPHYYAHEWLQSVRREHVRAFVGVHDEASGALVQRWPLLWSAHDSLDLIVAALQSDADAATLQRDFLDDAAVASLDDVDDAADDDPEAELSAHGFVLTDDDVAMKRLVVPATHWLGGGEFGAARRFVHTNAPLEQGMCGGVVNDKRRRFVGLIEGVVQAGPAHLVGAASLIERAAVAAFVRSEAAQKLGAVL